MPSGTGRPLIRVAAKSPLTLASMTLICALRAVIHAPPSAHGRGVCLVDDGGLGRWGRAALPGFPVPSLRCA